MKVLKSTLLAIFMAFLSSAISGQGNIGLKKKGDKIQLTLQQDGRLYIKTFTSWKELQNDKALKKFADGLTEVIGLTSILNGIKLEVNENVKVSLDGFEVSVNSEKNENGVTINVKSKNN